MKENIRSRNLAINSYIGMLVVAIVGGFATLYIVHIALDVPFTVFASPAVYDIGSTL